MKIINNWLVKEGNEKVILSRSANLREEIIPRNLVMHYTATETAQSAIDWFMNTQSNPDKIAAHIVIDLDGTITQLIPLNRRANHAGTSVWSDGENFNFFSIGIEIVNRGFCKKHADGKLSVTSNWKTGEQKFFKGNDLLKNIRQARHKHKIWDHVENQNWFIYPDKQIEAVIQLSKLLVSHYQLSNILGHDDISPFRKPDPGPLFPWDRIRTEVLGRPSDIGNIFTVDSSDGFAWFRDIPNKLSNTAQKLSNGFEVGYITSQGAWYKVYLCDKKSDVLIKIGKSDKSIKKIGWIHSSLLIKKPKN